MKGSKLGIRLLYYFGGFFAMTIGIALSVKSNLGVSPVSSIPYTMTCVWGIEMGVATVIFYVPADIMPLAGEGAMLAISTLTGKPFPTVKIAFDVSMVIISLITCLIFLHGLGSVGIGTVIAALLVGIELRMITHRFGRWRDKLLGKQSEI